MGNLPLAVRIHQYLATLAPHMREREAARLLAEAEDQLDRISEREFVAQAKAAIIGEWIPASDRVPDHGGTVVCRTADKELRFARVMRVTTHADGTPATAYHWMGYPGDPLDVTHWMPLPEPPDVT